MFMKRDVFYEIFFFFLTTTRKKVILNNLFYASNVRLNHDEPSVEYLEFNFPRKYCE